MTNPDRLIAEALSTDDLRTRDTAVALLAADTSAEAPLWTALLDSLETARSRGWQPEDLRYHLLRFHTPVHATVLTHLPSLDVNPSSAPSPGPGPGSGSGSGNGSKRTGGRKEPAAGKGEVVSGFAGWALKERIDRLEAVSVLLETVAATRRLPRIARLQRSERIDSPVLGRVRAMLAKAESTEYPAEAEALVTRAQEIMARHSIASVDRDDAPTGMRLPVDNPYEEAKATLLHVVAEANRCRAVWQAELGFSTVLGFPADLDAVELLYTSLLLQADRAMPKNGSKKRFRQAFLTSYVNRIGERLSQTTEELVTDDLLPILAERNEAVERAVDNLFPQLKTVRSRAVHDMDGWREGRRAADAADLN
ncbi:DUF2786 domain-containing protein [Actinocorallia longicatena]|uniref:DUF2786 domain-containing protein n=1 Tax=Actinocorallia longicatena TaxID=111803 RepID=A0ABP6QFA7_9ACTN